jgi:hypothetical protein
MNPFKLKSNLGSLLNKQRAYELSLVLKSSWFQTIHSGLSTFVRFLLAKFINYFYNAEV